MSSGQKWTTEMDDELKSHYMRGLSGARIAEQMRRGLSRNAVIGRIYRLGLNGTGPRKEPTTRAEREEKRKAREKVKIDRRRAQRMQFRLDNPRPPILETHLRCVELVPRHISLLELEPNDCRYPYGGEAKPIVFCGHAKMNGSPYCTPHHFLTIGAGTSSERSATRVPRLLEAAE